MKESPVKTTVMRWSTPPVFEGDRESLHRVKLLNIILVTTVLSTLLIIIGNLLGGKTKISTFAIDWLFLLASLVLHRLLHTGKFKLAATGTSVLGFIFITGAIISLGTIRTPTTALYLLFVVVTGTLFELNGILAATTVSSLAILGLIAAENAGLLPTPDYTVTITQWIMYTTLIGAAGMIVHIALKIMREALERSNREIDERKQAEKILSQSEEKYRSVVSALTEGIVLHDTHGVIITCNEAAESILGLTKDQMQGRTSIDPRWRSIYEDGSPFPGENHPAMITLKTGEAQRNVVMGIHKPDGTLTWISINSQPIWNNGNTSPNAVVASITDITERKQMAETLVNAEKDYRNIFEKAPIGIYRSTKDGKLLKVNQVMAELFGYATPKEAIENITNTATQVYADPTNRKELRTELDKFGHVEGWETRLRRKDGSIIWTSRYVRVIKDEKGEPLYFEGFTEDITRRKQIEEELRESELRFRALFEQTHDAVFILDLEGRHVAANQRAADMLGYTQEELAKLSVNDTSAELDQSLNIVNRLRAGEEIPSYERLFRKKDGQLLHVEINVELVRDKNGNPMHIQSVVRDISHRIEAEQAVRESELRYRNISNLISDYVFSFRIDEDGIPRREWTSGAFEHITGYKPDDPILDSGLGAIIHPDDRELWERRAERLHSGEADRSEFRIIHRDGTIRWLFGYGYGTYDKKIGRVTHAYGAVQDITERKKAEEILQRTAEQLSLRLTEIEQLQIELREQAIHDPLTNLYNRRYLDETLMRELARAKREKKYLSVIIMDIDHFKKINDTYGHHVGDKFIETIANLLKNQTRGSDIACRYGGEEFLLVLPGATKKAAFKRAEDFRQYCEKIRILQGSKELKITVSLGVASYPPQCKDSDEILIRADKAMYKSKRDGRNRVTVWDEK